MSADLGVLRALFRSVSDLKTFTCGKKEVLGQRDIKLWRLRILAVGPFGRVREQFEILVFSMVQAWDEIAGGEVHVQMRTRRRRRGIDRRVTLEGCRAGSPSYHGLAHDHPMAEGCVRRQAVVHRVAVGTWRHCCA